MKAGLLHAVLAAALLTGSAGARDHPVDWHKAASLADRERLRHWRDAWLEALGNAKRSGGAPELAADGDLFDPDHALDRATPPAGRYRCRTIRLGGYGLGKGVFGGGWSHCRVDGETPVAHFVDAGARQRTDGTIYEDNGTRSIYLGALMLGDETRHIPYGRDARRNMVGVVDRIGEARWRIALPYPSFQSTLDVIEMVPAPSDRPAG